MPRLLANDYGSSNTYTQKQVKITIEHGGLPVSDACYGVALFSNQSEFEQYHQEMDKNCDYESMRCEIADKHFLGNSSFAMSDVLSTAANYGGLDGEDFSNGVDAGNSGD